MDKADIGYGSWPDFPIDPMPIQFRFLDMDGELVASYPGWDFRFDIQMGEGGGCYYLPDGTATFILPLEPGIRVLEIVEKESGPGQCGGYEYAGRMLARTDLGPCIQQFCEAGSSDGVVCP